MAIAGAITRIRTSGYARRVMLLAGSTVLAQLVNFLSSFLLARLYAPADYGVFALFVSFVTIGGLVSTLCLEYGIVGADNSRAISLFHLSFGVCVIGSLLATIVFLVFHYGNIFSYGNLPAWYAPFVLGAVFSIGLFSIVRYWAIRSERFKGIGRVTVTRNLVRAAVQLVFPFIKPGPLGLISGELAGRLGGNLSLIRQDGKYLWRSWHRLQPGHYLKLLDKCRNYPLYLLPSQLITTVSIMLPAVLVVKTFGVKEGGYFGLVMNVIAVPVGLITGSLADVFHQKISVVQQGRERLFFRNAKLLLLLGIPAALGLYLLGPLLFPVLFGIQWAEAGTIASALSLLMLFQLLVIPLSRVVYVFKKERQKLVYDIVAFSSVVVPFALKAPLNLSFLEVIWLFSLLRSVSYLVYFFVLLRIVRREEQASASLLSTSNTDMP